VNINSLEFDIASMQYNLRSRACQLPNTGLQRNYTFARVNGDMLLAGTTGGEICVFSIQQAIYRASMPLTSNGIICGIVCDESFFVGGGDGKIKKVSLANNSWTLTHEAQLDSRIMSMTLSQDKGELIVGTQGGKIYRVLTNDLSFLLHSDAHISCINDVAFGQDSNIFAAADEQGALKVWDLSDYKCTGSYFPSRASPAISTCFAKNDQTVLVGYRDGCVRCYDVLNQKAMLWEMTNCHRGGVTALYADSNYILSGGCDGAIRIWARNTRQMLLQFNGKTFLPLANIYSFNRSTEGYSCCIPRHSEVQPDPLVLGRQDHQHVRPTGGEES
jgi:cilia- and flagella-associated protein 52